MLGLDQCLGLVAMAWVRGWAMASIRVRTIARVGSMPRVGGNGLG